MVLESVSSSSYQSRPPVLKHNVIEIPIESKAPENKLHVCGVHFHNFSRPVQFLLCTVAVFALFLLYGYFQEWIFHVEELRKSGMFITLIQFGFYGMFGLIEQRIHGNAERKIPLKSYILLACLTIGTMGLSNTSLGYLNYPTQVIFKSSKLIPVMIGGILIQGKTYKASDFVACCCMTGGIILFTYGDQKLSPNFNVIGVILISLALCADAVIGNVQELNLRKYSASNAEMVLYSYSIGFVILFCGHSLYGGLLHLLGFVLQNPRCLAMIFLFSLTGYLGILFVLQLVRSFNALIAVTVTTCRKAVTIVLSFLFFAKPFTAQYAWGGLLVLIGIVLNVMGKNQNHIKQLRFSFHRRQIAKLSDI